jgi:hypothetical protein
MTRKVASPGRITTEFGLNSREVNRSCTSVIAGVKDE